MSTTPIFYRIREVSELLSVPNSTLRFWESEFPQLNPDRTSSGQRRYRTEDVEVCKLIKRLLRDKGYSLNYAKAVMSVYRKCPPRNTFVCRSDKDAQRLLSEARKMADSEHIIARIESVENWIKQSFI